MVDRRRRRRGEFMCRTIHIAISEGGFIDYPRNIDILCMTKQKDLLFNTLSGKDSDSFLTL